MLRILRECPIGVKVALAPVFAIFCLAAIAFIGWHANRSLTVDLQAIGGEGVARISNAQALAESITELHQRTYQSLTWEAVGDRAEKIAKHDAALLKSLTDFTTAMSTTANDPGLAVEQRQELEGLKASFGGYAKLVRDTLDVKSAGMATAASFVVMLDEKNRECVAI
ncbi:MAG: hypothetical protein H7039_04165, partial [Bryobacteraceae bacterium]|nr:hypothetical protein [Bryobacteraceae bacterium]